MFPEQANGGLNLSDNATPIGVGWDPVVVEVLANMDGGKTIAGFGKLTGTIYGSWVIKMWGTTGGKACAANSAITGYVTMIPGLNSEFVIASCALASNAPVQWAWTNVANDQATTSTNRYSVVLTSATEEGKWGTLVTEGSGALGTRNALIIVAGGSTMRNQTAYGLNSWSFAGYFIDENGTTSGLDSRISLVEADTTEPLLMPIVQLDAAVPAVVGVWSAAVYETGKNNENAQRVSNHCWTAVSALPTQATDDWKAHIGGYSGSITSCLKHAVDGYSFWGATIMARVGKDWGAD